MKLRKAEVPRQQILSSQRDVEGILHEIVKGSKAFPLLRSFAIHGSQGSEIFGQG